MSTDIPHMAGKYNQFKAGEESKVEEKTIDIEGGISTTWTTRSTSELSPDMDRFLAWLIRYPLSRYVGHGNSIL